MRILFMAALLLLSKAILSQGCSCMDDFNFIKDHIEKNHGGFNRKIKSPEEPAYKKFTDELKAGIARLTDERYCIAYLKKYILYLQDHHSNITGSTGQPVNEKDSAAVAAFLQGGTCRNTEVINLSPAYISIYLEESKDPLEGIYQTTDGTYKVAVIKNKTSDRDYAGFIVSSATPLWTTGQVKFELKKENDSVFHYFGYLRNHALTYEQLPVNDKTVSIPGWIKQNSEAQAPRAVIDNELIRFTVLDSQTTLLSIRDFSSQVYKKLDSAYKIIIPEIKKYPRLVLDVRNNGGGADFSYMPLMPLLYTDTIFNDVVDIYNSPGNEAAYKKFDSLSVSRGNRAVFSRSLGKMKNAAPYTFVPMGDGKPSGAVYPAYKGNPVKAAVLYNRGCASSCESLLFDLVFSRKTIFVGENSGGYTGYGDVMNIQTPCGRTLSWTTTVYRNQWKYEFVGIPPQYKIPGTVPDWVEYTRRLLASQ